MVARERVSLEHAFILHHREYRDTSRILDVFSARHGRLTLFARGARGPSSSGCERKSISCSGARASGARSRGSSMGTGRRARGDRGGNGLAGPGQYRRRSARRGRSARLLHDPDASAGG